MTPVEPDSPSEPDPPEPIGVPVPLAPLDPGAPRLPESLPVVPAPLVDPERLAPWFELELAQALVAITPRTRKRAAREPLFFPGRGQCGVTSMERRPGDKIAASTQSYTRESPPRRPDELFSSARSDDSHDCEA
jgi:hypothetical protein